jgi:hypothetical protein
LINNRQGGRRRGRGGQRGQGGQPGNRQDNRQRGNAAQLLEKYKSMARDAQLSGDRVQTEYYLQYADHYFRVLGESQSRFDNQRRSRDDRDDEDGDEGEDEMSEAEAAESDQDDRPERQPRRERSYRNDGDDRPRRAEQRTERRPEPRADQAEAREVEERPVPVERAERPAPRRRSNGTDEAAMPLSALPPAIGRSDELEAGETVEEAPKPRRRTRTARPTASDDETAPAA